MRGFMSSRQPDLIDLGGYGMEFSAAKTRAEGVSSSALYLNF